MYQAASCYWAMQELHHLVNSGNTSRAGSVQRLIFLPAAQWLDLEKCIASHSALNDGTEPALTMQDSE